VADIFISYARPDRPAAERLAKLLIAKGYSVWWDTELLGSDDFRDVIHEELRAAKACIVIGLRIRPSRVLSAMKLISP
jgi:TIR domain-containing protein